MESPVLFVGIMLVPAILSYLVGFFEPTSAVFTITDTVIFVTIMLVLFVVNVFMAIAMANAFANRSLSVVDAYKMSKVHFWRYIGFSIVLSLILGIAYILLIIPGIIATVWFAFAFFVLVLENKGIKDSLKQSREYVRGRWWGVAGRMLGLILLSALLGIVIALVAIPLSYFLPEMLVALVIVAGNMVITPITMGYLYALYQDVSGGAVKADQSAPATTPAGYQPASSSPSAV